MSVLGTENNFVLATEAGMILGVDVSTFDPDAATFFTVAAITDSTQKSAVNQLVLDLKAADIWTKMRAIYPMVGGTALTHKWNLKDPRDLDAVFRLFFVGGWTHTATGAKPNGTTGYANTFFVPSTQFASINDGGISFYGRAGADGGSAVEIGANTSNGVEVAIQLNSTGGIYPVWGGGQYPSAPASTNGGFHIVNRLSTTNTQGFLKGVKVMDGAQTNTALPNLSILIAATHDWGGVSAPARFSPKECAFAAIHDGLTVTEATSFSTAVDNCQNTLSRAVDSFTPASLGTRLKWWYRAGSLNLANGASVASWEDSSGNASAATQATANLQPTFMTNQINGKPIVRFGGFNDALATGLIDLSGVQKISIFAVYKQTAAQRGVVYEHSANFNNSDAFVLMTNVDNTAHGASHVTTPSTRYSAYDSGQLYNTFKVNRMDLDLTAAPNTRIYTNNVLDNPTTISEDSNVGSLFSNQVLYIAQRSGGTFIAAMDIAELFAVINPTAQDICRAPRCYFCEFPLKFGLVFVLTVGRSDCLGC